MAKEEKLIIILTLFPPNHFSPSIGQAAHIFIFLTASVAAEKKLLPDLFTSRKKNTYHRENGAIFLLSGHVYF